MVSGQDRNKSLAQVSAQAANGSATTRATSSAGALNCSTPGRLATPQPEIAKTWPPQRRYGMPVLARLAPPIVNTYKFNLFQTRDTQR